MAYAIVFNHNRNAYLSEDDSYTTDINQAWTTDEYELALFKAEYKNGKNPQICKEPVQVYIPEIDDVCDQDADMETHENVSGTAISIVKNDDFIIISDSSNCQLSFDISWNEDIVNIIDDFMSLEDGQEVIEHSLEIKIVDTESDGIELHKGSNYINLSVEQLLDVSEFCVNV